jgi:hypothetical protein
MKLRSTADFAELEQKVVGFTGLRILVMIERANSDFSSMGVAQKLVILAALHTRLIYSHLDEPRAELGISPERMQVYKGFEKRLPRRFLGVRFILQY